MFGKRSRGYQADELSPRTRFRANLEDLFLNNEVSGLRARDYFADGEAAGNVNFRRLARAGASGQAPNHIHRDLLRTILKGCQWPKPYIFEIPVWSAKEQKMKTSKLAMLLPHELIRAICGKGDLATIFQTDGLSQDALHHLNEVQTKSGTAQLLGLGIWMDGTPCNWDRTKSVETVAMSLPGQVGQLANMRLPLTAIMKHHMVKRQTIDAILLVVAWSMQCAFQGTMPSSRHDGSAWHQSDSKRSKLASKTIGCQSVLVEVRADWACLKQTFGFPGWRETRGCCFRCDIKPAEVSDASSWASWRSPARRHTHWSLMQQIVNQGQKISPLFSCPFMSSMQMAIDWLHCCDLGVAQDFLGNFFIYILTFLPGTNNDQRVAALFLRMQSFYTRTKAESRLDDLSYAMLRKAGSAAPKLRSKAGESRCLVPFAAELARELLTDATDTMQQTVKECAVLLNRCYSCLTRATYVHELLQQSSRKFCTLYAALAAASDNLWTVKPKFHLWQELCEESTSCPATCWTYRDEDFGGSMAKLAHSRGGPSVAGACSFMVLQKFRARHSLPALE